LLAAVTALAHQLGHVLLHAQIAGLHGLRQAEAEAGRLRNQLVQLGSPHDKGSTADG
jgi:hypothetical protein